MEQFAIALIVVATGVVFYLLGARDGRSQVERTAPYQATMTLLPDGAVVFGTPPDTTQEQMVHLRDGIGRWTEGKGTLVLPWPTEVRNLRHKSFGQQYR